MGMLPARHYESDHTKFIRDVLEQRPAIADEQRAGRALWWDKSPRDLDARRAMDEAKVPQKGYVYFSWK